MLIAKRINQFLQAFFIYRTISLKDVVLDQKYLCSDFALGPCGFQSYLVQCTSFVQQCICHFATIGQQLGDVVDCPLFYKVKAKIKVGFWETANASPIGYTVRVVNERKSQCHILMSDQYVTPITFFIFVNAKANEYCINVFFSVANDALFEDFLYYCFMQMLQYVRLIKNRKTNLLTSKYI